MNLSALFDKRVISVAEAAFMGNICGIFVKNGSFCVRYFVMQEEFLENVVLRQIPFTKIYNYGNDAVTVMNALCIKSNDCTNVSACIFIKLGLAVYNDKGDFIGSLEDVEIEDTGGRVTAYVVGGNSFAPNDVASVSDNMLIIGKRPRKPRTATKVRKPKTDYSVSTLSVVPTETAPTLDDAFGIGGEPVPEYHIPARLITDYSFLLNRLVLADIYSLGDVIISRGTAVTEAVVETARRHGKLAELTLNSKE